MRLPTFVRRYRNRSAEARAHHARAAQRQRDSWEQMKAAVAAKYAAETTGGVE